MQHPYHALTGVAANIPVSDPTPIRSINPVILSSSSRPVDLHLRISFPSTTTSSLFPIILLSHGHGPSNWLSSLNGYAPIAEFWAAHGFVVIQPTHLSSRTLSFTDWPAGQEMYWRSRVEDMIAILDRLGEVEAQVPELKGRLDPEKIAVAGHSLGGMTACMLLGASNTDPRDNSCVHCPDARIKAGVILAAPGNGGADLSASGRERLPFYAPDFGTMSAPALVLAGDEDNNPALTVRGAEWHRDSYACSPGSKSLFVVRGAKHGLGGISGWDAAETGDESPQRLAAVQRVTWAYLKSQLYEEDGSWPETCKALEGLSELGWLESKSR